MIYYYKFLIKIFQKKEFYWFFMACLFIVFLTTCIVFELKKTSSIATPLTLDLPLLVKTQVNFIKNVALTNIFIFTRLFLSNFIFLMMGLLIQILLFKSVKKEQISSKFIHFFYLAIIAVYCVGIGLKIGMATSNIGIKFNYNFLKSITLLGISIMWHGIPEFLINIMFIYTFVYEKYLKTLKFYKRHPNSIAIVNNHYIKRLFFLMPLCAFLLLISAYLETQSGLALAYYKNHYLFK